ncbi:MAG: aspartate kinase [Bacteriovoracaceae bacterium]|nr:aspartate kinase [Bacteriovoracaceae bacterium]
MLGHIVSKFGGSIVKDADSMNICADIVKKFTNIKVVILSATFNTTNVLDKIASLARAGIEDDALGLLFKLRDDHLKIVRDLDIEENSSVVEELEELINEGKSLVKGIVLLKACPPKILDSLYSLGERISTILFAEVLTRKFYGEKDIKLFDVRKILKTNSDFTKATPRLEKIAELTKIHLMPLIQKDETIVVTQGFIGEDVDGMTTTLGREGSDFSAALIAEATRASLLQIWTDTPGIATIDPKFSDKARFIPEMTYREARVLAHLGAKVLFPNTLSPMMRINSPVFVGSGVEPELGGTWIKSDISDLPYLRAITFMRNKSIVTLCGYDFESSHDFFRQTISTLHHFNVGYDFVNFTGNSVSFLCHNVDDLSEQVVEKLIKYGHIQIEDDLSLVSFAGSRMDRAPNLIAEIFNSLTSRSIRMVKLGTTAHSISFVVPGFDTDYVVSAFHDYLLQQNY